jgi:hypothetical protein
LGSHAWPTDRTFVVDVHDAQSNMPQHRVLCLLHVLKESREMRDAGRIGFAEFNAALCGKCACHARILTRFGQSRKRCREPVSDEVSRQNAKRPNRQPRRPPLLRISRAIDSAFYDAIVARDVGERVGVN